tara:strand:+ start:1858 stop:2199 length:342 start_codon:yes stop_codon:yes gene_type:complete
LLKFLETEGKHNPFDKKQSLILSSYTVTYLLGKHFSCPPHSWDNMPPDRVYLDYIFMQSALKIEQNNEKKQQRNNKRYNANSNQNKGRPIRTTSDSANLEDFFDRTNANLSDG